VAGTTNEISGRGMHMGFTFVFPVDGLAPAVQKTIDSLGPIFTIGAGLLVAGEILFWGIGMLRSWQTDRESANMSDLELYEHYRARGDSRWKDYEDAAVDAYPERFYSDEELEEVYDDLPFVGPVYDDDDDF
jgi:hypothetical protein